MSKLKSKIIKSVIASSLPLTLLSCSIELDKPNIYKVDDISSVVRLEYKISSKNYTIKYHFFNSAFVLLVTDNETIINTVNSYIKDTNALIYYMDYSSYNNFIEHEMYGNFKNRFPSFTTPSNDIGNVLFINKGNLFRNQKISTNYAKDNIKKLVEENGNLTNFYYMNVDINYTDKDSFIVENDDSNIKIIYDSLETEKLDDSYFFSKLNPNEISYVYFLRKTCGDCEAFTSKVINPYFKEHTDKRLYLFDLFIFENYKDDSSVEHYNNSREFVKSDNHEIKARFNYNNFDDTGKLVSTNETYDFRFPTLITYKAGKRTSEEDIVIYSNDTISNSNSSYYVSQSFYSIDMSKFISNSENNTKESLQEFEKEKTIEFLNKY